jgi:hypothetical protein
MGNSTWGEINIGTLDSSLIDIARQKWEKGDVSGVFATMPNTHCLAFVFDNLPLLKKIGKYEEALFHSYIGTRTNHSNWSMDVLSFLFQQADVEILRKTGDPIPDQDVFTLYRGVSGIGRKRRVNGLSWTDSLNTAAWFARRFCDLPDPAVFKVVIPNESIMACCNERKEKEYLLRLPLPVKPKRLKNMPEVFLQKNR